MPGVPQLIPRDRLAERTLRCVLGLALFGIGIAMLIDSELGAAPWDVFHTGVCELTGIPVGTVIILVGITLLVLWIPLRERPGLGTILNAIEIGLVVDLVLPLLPEPDQLGVRLSMMSAGVVLVAFRERLKGNETARTPPSRAIFLHAKLEMAASGPTKLEARGHGQ